MIRHLIFIVLLTVCSVTTIAQTLRSVYTKTGCGLNYVQVSRKVTNRHAQGGAGTGLPATLSLAGLPANNCIEKAYVWIENSYNGGSPNAPTFSITNPGGTTASYTPVKTGEHIEKCWGEIGTRTYRVDVTASVTTNGNYIINTNIPVDEIDGATLVVIYNDQAATYIGNLIIYDGLISSQGTNVNLTMSGFNACSAGTNGRGFIISGDFQLAQHNAIINGVSGVYPDQFWSFDSSPVTVTAGQTTSNYGAGPLAFDCFAVIATGLYFQTTCGLPPLVVAGNLDLCPGQSTVLTATGGGCAPYNWQTTPPVTAPSVTLTPSAPGVSVTVNNRCNQTATVFVKVDGPTSLTINTTPATCSQSNGTATVSGVTGGTAPYVYQIDGGAFGASTTFSNLSVGSHTIMVRDSKGCLYQQSFTITNTPGPTAMQTSAVNATCNLANGQINIGAVTGGTLPYNYSIDGGTFSSVVTYANLAPGNHTVTVRDANGCIFQVTQLISNTPGPTAIQFTTSNETCNQSNGSVTITGATGGAAPYTYSFGGSAYGSTTSFANLAAGSYSVKVKDANNCDYQTSANVGNTPGPTDITTSVVNSNCGNADGQIAVTNVTGGVSPYQYSINGGAYSSSTIFANLAANGYTISVRDNNSCTYSEISNIVDQGGPSAATATTTDALCGQSTGSITISNVVGGSSPYSYSLNGGTYGASSSFTNLVPGSYSVSIKDNNGCIYSLTSTVLNKPGINSGVKQVIEETCTASNGSYTIASVSGGTSPYNYSINGGPYSTLNVFSNLGAGNYSVMVRDVNGCTLKLDTFLINYAGPTALTSTSTSEICSQNNGSIVVTSTTGGTTPFVYSLDNTTFTSGGTFSSLAAGGFTIYVQDANNCPYQQPAVVPALPGPTDLNFTHTPTNCNQNNGTLTVSSTVGGASPYSYRLDGQAAVTTTTFNNVSPGSHTVEVTDANGCTYQESYSVTNVGGPTAVQLTGTNPTCGNPNGQINIGTVTGGVAPYMYSFNSGAPGTQTAFTNLAAGVYAVVVSDNTGCTFSSSYTLIDQAGPTDLLLAPVTTTCGSNNGSITVSSVTGGTSQHQYSLDGITYQPGTTFSALLSGNYTVYVTDLNACLYSESIIIPDAPGPTAFNISSVNETCGNSNGRLTISAVVGGTQPHTYSKDGINYTSSPVFSALAAGAFTLFVKDNNGCVFSKSTNITNSPGPTSFVLTAVPSTCGNSNGSLSVSNVIGGKLPFTYQLNSGGFSNQSTFTGLPSAVNHTVTVRDANGCLLAQSTVISNIAGPSDFTATPTSSTCSSNNGSFNITNVVDGTAQYSFSIDNITFSPSGTFSNLLSNTYTAYVRDANNCAFNKTVFVGDMPSPVAFASTVVAENCLRKDGAISVTGVTGGTAPYQYSLAGQAFNNGTSQDSLTRGIYPVTVTDFNGCTYNSNVEVPYLGFPRAAFEMDPAVGDYPLFVNFTNTSQSATSYKWFFGTGDSAITAHTNYQYQDSGSFPITLVAYNAGGCSDTTQQFVRALLPVFVHIPNAFTPNSDGVNDLFLASTFGFRNHFMEVYNRNGTRIQLWDETSPGWDGLYQGELVKEDVYNWVFVGMDIYGKKHKRIGHVLMLK